MPSLAVGQLENSFIKQLTCRSLAHFDPQSSDCLDPRAQKDKSQGFFIITICLKCCYWCKNAVTNRRCACLLFPGFCIDFQTAHLYGPNMQFLLNKSIDSEVKSHY